MYTIITMKIFTYTQIHFNETRPTNHLGKFQKRIKTFNLTETHDLSLKINTQLHKHMIPIQK